MQLTLQLDQFYFLPIFYPKQILSSIIFLNACIIYFYIIVNDPF